MRRMLPLVAIAGAALLLSACSSPTPAPTATATTTVSAPATTGTPSSSATTSPSPATSTSSSASAAGDPDRPADQCPDADLRVTFGPGDGAAGTEYVPIVFTNTGTRSCVLRGAPGVSVVGDGNGTQLGKPADRDQSGAQDVRLDAHGGQAHATLAIVDLSPTDGSPLGGCTPKRGDGYRVYPPHSTRAFFVRDSKALACDPGPVFMRVDVVASGASGAK